MQGVNKEERLVMKIGNAVRRIQPPRSLWLRRNKPVACRARRISTARR